MPNKRAKKNDAFRELISEVDSKKKEVLELRRSLLLQNMDMPEQSFHVLNGVVGSYTKLSDLSVRLIEKLLKEERSQLAQGNSKTEDLLTHIALFLHKVSEYLKKNQNQDFSPLNTVLSCVLDEAQKLLDLSKEDQIKASLATIKQLTDVSIEPPNQEVDEGLYAKIQKPVGASRPPEVPPMPAANGAVQQQEAIPPMRPIRKEGASLSEASTLRPPPLVPPKPVKPVVRPRTKSPGPQGMFGAKPTPTARSGTGATSPPTLPPKPTYKIGPS